MPSLDEYLEKIKNKEDSLKRKKASKKPIGNPVFDLELLKAASRTKKQFRPYDLLEEKGL